MNKDNINRERYLFDPFDDAKLNKLRQYDEFKAIPAKFKGGSILCYLVLAYDLNSDLRKEYPSRPQQKYQAAILAGFNLTDKKFDSGVEELILGNNYDFDKALVKYLSLFGRVELMALEAYYLQLNQEMKLIITGEAEKKNTDNVEVLYKRINDLTKILFFGEETITARKALYDFIAQPNSIRPSPENIAEMLEKGVNPLEGTTPYGMNYEPTKQSNYLKFKNLRDNAQKNNN
jgi:hypothetical protein